MLIERQHALKERERERREEVGRLIRETCKLVVVWDKG